MKFLLTTTLLVSSSFAYAGKSTPVMTTETTTKPHARHSSPLDHAPAGIMPDHLHKAGEWMLGYHYMHMAMDGQRKGTDKLSTEEVFGLGFTGASEAMTMDMQMVEIMYAPTDWLTLMAMINYEQKDMEMTVTGGAHGHGSHGAHGTPTKGTARHSHSTEGLGDTSLSALFPIFRNELGTSIIGAIGVSAPTGAVDKKENGMYQPYGMQLGSGTWDLLPGVTAVQHAGQFQFGGQVGGIIRLEEEGDSGFSRGERYFAHGWVGYELTDWLGVNATLTASTEGELEGHYNGGHQHSAPEHFQGNYGGDLVEAGLGFNVLTPGQWGALLGNQRIGVRGTVPVHQDLNGVGMSTDWSLYVSWQKAF